MRKRISQVQNSNKGFTLVELIVVLVLMMILLSLTIFGGLAWQDWTRFKHENSVAEDIFFAAQNQLTELDAGGSMQRVVIQPLRGTNPNQYNGYNPQYVLAYSLDSYVYDDAFNTMYKTDGTKYVWTEIWKDAGNAAVITGSSVDPIQSYAGRTILKLTANKGDYTKYLDQKAGNGNSLDAGTVLLFDLIAPYLSDKSVLDGSIRLEFSPEAGQVFSVCYSDRIDSFSSGSVDVGNRTESIRRDAMLGYYGVDTLTEKIKGKGVLESNLLLEIKNSEILEFIVRETTSGNGALDPGKTINFTVYNGADNGKTEVMNFSFVMPDSSAEALPATMAGATENPRTITVNLSAGKYSGKEKTFRVPVWKDDSGLHFIMDGADVQAATSVFVRARDGAEDGNDAVAFRNTYSFYRFGLGDDVKYIYASVNGGSGSKEADSIRRVGAADLLVHAENANDNGTYGECATFEAVNSGDIYTIKNGRHFYNVRYETEYKKTSVEKTFKLVGNIDWSEFVGKGGGTNYFLNSFVSAQGSTVKAGIDYNGSAKATGGDGVHENTNTQNMPFPGFRCLGKGDTFTQETGDDYVVSNLTISFAANIIYGVYDKYKVSETEDYGGSLGTDHTAFIGGDYSSVIKNVEYVADTKTFSFDKAYARAGKMPLGLFAENLGHITNITLKNHVVKGIEDGTYAGEDNVVATNMVGGFVGNNLGELKNLTLGEKGDNSSVSGRTDVGGILGRQSFIALGSRDVVLEELTNYAPVSGLENVGGIIGRAYTHYVGEENQERNLSSITVTGSTAPINGTFSSGTPEFYKNNPRYRFYHDGYEITDTGKSMTGVDIQRANEITIQKCTNFGIVDGAEVYHRLESTCAFIGGIAGVAMDGFIYDYDQRATVSGKGSNNKQYNKNEILPFYRDLGYFEGKFTYVTISECASIFDNAESYITANIANNDRVKYNNYVGGLVGYARLIRFENCNEKLNSNDSQPGIILGNRYVGGVAGCSDMSLYVRKNGAYATTNYNAVIGNRYVGGVAGVFGIGDVSQGELSFREPSKNDASKPSQTKGIGSSYVAGGYSLNTGVVLGVKSPELEEFISVYPGTDKRYYEVKSNVNHGIGGVAGGLRCSIECCDSIQSSATKDLTIRFITNDQYKKLDEFDAIGQSDMEGFVQILESSKYGGVNVGGIVGYVMGLSAFNLSGSLNYNSKVDAVVFGQERVGGVVGTVDPDSSSKLTFGKCQPDAGLHVYGLDSVGGIVGVAPDKSKITVDQGIVKGFVVRGRYGVGGAFGAIGKQCDFNISKMNPMDGKVKVYGLAYVGGFAGVVDAADFLTNGRRDIVVSNVEVVGKYFAGGLYGAMANGATVTFSSGGKVRLGSNVTVNAGAFAGGIAGLYYDNIRYAEFTKIEKDGSTNKTKHTGDLYGIINKYLLNEGKLKAYNTTNEPAGAVILQLGVTASGSKELDLKDVSCAADVTSYVHAGGLFGYVPDGINLTVKNLLVDASQVATSGTVSADEGTGNGQYTYLGGVVGRIPSGMVVENCINNVPKDKYNALADSSYRGGITEVNAGTIKGTDSDALVNSRDYEYSSFTGKLGAFAGLNKGAIQYCINNGKITSGGTAAGIAGECISIGKDTSWSIKDCSNGGTISGDKYAAGITGIISCNKVYDKDDIITMIQSCSNAASVTANGTDGTVAAGIVAVMKDKTRVTECTNNGAVTGITAAGIVGEMNGDKGASITLCYNEEASITGTKVAGIVGTMKGTTTVEECYNRGDIRINTNDGFAAGICATVEGDGTKIIHYCRNYGPTDKTNGVTGETRYGITCGSGVNLYGNLAANGYVVTLVDDDNDPNTDEVAQLSNFIGPDENDDTRTTEFDQNYYIYDDETKPVDGSGSGAGADADADEGSGEGVDNEIPGSDNDPKQQETEGDTPKSQPEGAEGDDTEGEEGTEEGSKKEGTKKGGSEEGESEEEAEENLTPEDSQELDGSKPIHLVIEKVTIEPEQEGDAPIIKYNIYAVDEAGLRKEFLLNLEKNLAKADNWKDLDTAFMSLVKKND